MARLERKLSGGIAAPTSTGVPRVVTANGIETGRFGGYLATWDPDTGGKFGVPDQFVRGAFRRSIEEHERRGGRPIRLKYMHGPLIGAFPVDLVVEDSAGLRVVGEINLSTALGRDVWALIQQGALSDLSIGFITTRDKIEAGVRKIFEAVLVEGSVVDEPANRGAQILSAKASEPASLETILEDLQGMTESLRAPRRAARRSPRVVAHAPRVPGDLGAILNDLNATRDALRR